MQHPLVVSPHPLVVTNDDDNERRVFLAGQSGSGKSFALALLHRTGRPDRLHLVLDVLREHRGSAVSVVRRPPGGRLTTASGPYHHWVDRWSEWAFNRGRTYLYIDEASLCVVKKVHAPPWLVVNCIDGRHQRNGLFLATQRPCSVPPDLTAQCEEQMFFRLRGHRDLAYVAAMGASREVVRMLPKLRRGHHIHMGPGFDPHLHTYLTQQCNACLRL